MAATFPWARSVVMPGFSRTRGTKSAVFQFTPVAGATITNPTVTVELGASFATWYGQSTSSQFGSSFQYVQTFLLTLDASTIGAVSGTLVTPVGSSNTKGSQ